MKIQEFLENHAFGTNKLWAKKFSEVHLPPEERFAGVTLCGKPMLGNNYAPVGVDENRNICPECQKLFQESQGKIHSKDKFIQLCVWPACVVGADQVAKFEKFMAENFHGTRIKYIEEVKTTPDINDGKVVEGTGDRNDVFFYVHTEDLGKFAVPRLAYGIRWWEDVVDNGNHHIYPQEVLDKYLKKEEQPKPKVKLLGQDNNVFGLIGLCQRALKKAGQKDNATKLAMECFKCGSYDEALQVMMKYCDVR